MSSLLTLTYLIIAGISTHFISTSQGAEIAVQYDKEKEPISGPDAFKARVSNFLSDLNCGLKSGAPPSDKLMNGINHCMQSATTTINDTQNGQLCLFPCIGNQIGLISSNGTFQSQGALEILKELYPLEPTGNQSHSNWVDRIQNCFHQYEGTGLSLYTDVQQCNVHQDQGHKDALSELSKCFVLSRNCGNPNSKAYLGRNILTRTADKIGEYIPGVQVGLETKRILNAITMACSSRAWCTYRGYCASYCGTFLNEGEWCYTTSNPLSVDALGCYRDKDCKPCWKCAGTCSSGWLY